MCLKLVTEREQKLRVAEKDIEVFKICRVSKGTIMSYFYDKTWDELGKTYKTPLISIFRHTENAAVTFDGFYSYQKNVKIKYHYSDGYTVKGVYYGGIPLVKVKCIIPEGSRYYHADEQYISDQIIPISYEFLKQKFSLSK